MNNYSLEQKTANQKIAEQFWQEHADQLEKSDLLHILIWINAREQAKLRQARFWKRHPEGIVDNGRDNAFGQPREGFENDDPDRIVEDELQKHLELVPLSSKEELLKGIQKLVLTSNR
jgi:hypothetical protein